MAFEKQNAQECHAGRANEVAYRTSKELSLSPYAGFIKENLSKKIIKSKPNERSN